MASRADHRPVAALVSAILGCSGLLAVVLRVVEALVQEARGPGSTTPEAALTLAAAATCLLLLSWVCLGLVLTILELLPGWAGRTAARAAERVTPSALRRCAAVLLGVGLGSTLTPGSAVASAGPVPGYLHAGPTAQPEWPTQAFDPPWSPSSASPSPWTPAASAPAGDASPNPGWTPSRPTRSMATPNLLSSTRRLPSAAPGAEVVVRRGDTLWDIAAGHLGADATDSAIAAEWPRWFEANRDVIGGDPDVILPGQRLRPPHAS